MVPDTGPAGPVSPPTPSPLNHQDHKRSHDGNILFSPSLLMKVVSGAEQLLPRGVLSVLSVLPPSLTEAPISRSSLICVRHLTGGMDEKDG